MLAIDPSAPSGRRRPDRPPVAARTADRHVRPDTPPTTPPAMPVGTAAAAAEAGGAARDQSSSAAGLNSAISLSWMGRGTGS